MLCFSFNKGGKIHSHSQKDSHRGHYKKRPKERHRGRKENLDEVLRDQQRQQRPTVNSNNRYSSVSKPSQMMDNPKPEDKDSETPL